MIKPTAEVMQMTYITHPAKGLLLRTPSGNVTGMSEISLNILYLLAHLFY